MPQLYIAGIHTDAGKTHFCALFCKAFGYDYFKIVQAGNPQDRDFIARFLPKSAILPNGITLETAASPHIAKHIEQREYAGLDISLPSVPNLLIELAGGLFSPLDEQVCMIEYMQHFPRACILVGRNYVGSINHLLLSVQALRISKIKLLCVVIMEDKDSAHSKLMNEFLRGHALLQGIPLMRASFFTPQTFLQAASELEATLSPILDRI